MQGFNRVRLVSRRAHTYMGYGDSGETNIRLNPFTSLPANGQHLTRRSHQGEE
jgi:hypothetical protein